jgi:hypothetical protein
MSDDKRRLPILQPRDDDAEPVRPSWHWAVIGMVTVLLVWIPLGMLTKATIGAVMNTLLPDDPKAAMDAFAAYSPAKKLAVRLMVRLGPMLPLAGGGVLGGMWVGLFGGGAANRDATAGGAGAAVVMVALEATQQLAKGGVDFLMVAAMMIVLGAFASRAGAAIGQRLARRGGAG